MFRTLYRKLPQPVRRIRHDFQANCISLFWILTNAVFDTWKYAKFSRSLKKTSSKANDQALLTFYYHKIEKGMALPSPRHGFGSSWIVPNFLPLLETYSREYGDDDTVRTCRKALVAYLGFHAQPNSQQGEPTVRAIEAYLTNSPSGPSNCLGGVKEVSVKTLEANWAVDFERFAAARHSVRVFANKQVDPTLVERAVSTAQKAPSVCNRQAWRVYALSEAEAVKKALAFQNGNAGFGDQIPCLLLVTCDTSAMLFSYERNQIYIDGGLFSMTLVYALQSVGLASCCLNLCLPWTIEKRLARLYQIPDCERAIMMIAVGYLPERVFVAQSQRQALNSVLKWRDHEVSSFPTNDSKS
jgi:nitroreductase